MAMYNLVPPFREATFCGVRSCNFDKLGCTAAEKSLWNTYLDDTSLCLFAFRLSAPRSYFLRNIRTTVL
jgi:hypothetical protein